MKKKNLWVPDILYHATTEKQLAQYRASESILNHRGKKIFLSRSEGHAWQVAHRFQDQPVVLIINTSQARKQGVFFEKNQHGLWFVSKLPFASVMNVQDGFQMQISCGGIPVFEGENGHELALIRVRHHHSTTWEVSKGRMEIGETPIMTAKREVQEEMGVEFDFGVSQSLGSVRFGFLTKNKEARLKEMHLFLLHVHNKPLEFTPAIAEGVIDISWFSVDDALASVQHKTLKPIFRQLKYQLKSIQVLGDS